ncbi:U-box domain-containing protein 16-like isoform X2 [Phalaenopsis equestris]|uniref:U-box domain-containing protein 16-like isoform X1 n=1 Tax=Phalaenopsis equestris TaxID=78828 RepID=UPI0009E4ADF9|nr:U-box domain-containing protein 16-like isoform X1 [Phalaenopsis equestris]XP_020598175.1 U-box domain-containing protein 16-like isoform X2 [Phalaenopsis equestris]
MAEFSFSISSFPLPLPSPPPPPPPPAVPSDGDLLRSLLRLSREISLFDVPCPLLCRFFSSLTRKSKILCILFEELLQDPTWNASDLPRSASLCLREILVVLQRFKALLGDCSARSRMRLLLQIDSIGNDFHELTLDLSTLLDILPLPDLHLTDDVRDLVDLLRRQCRRSNPAVDPKDDALRYEILFMIREIEQEVVPDLSRLTSIFEQLGFDGTRSCRNEIECLEREIGDRVSEKWTPAMIALVGVVRYAKCVLYGASTPTSDSSAGKLSFAESDPLVPPDFRCPISLELMRDPVVVASGQTYDGHSITRWIAAGHSACPMSGQALSHTNLVPNRALRNLISAWCREQNVTFYGFDSNKGEPPSAICTNKAALEAARMTATFLVKKLASSQSTELANRVVHELRLLAKTGSENRAFVAEAGAIPLLLPFLSSEDSTLQLNAVTALLNLSILEANKKRIMHAEGGIDDLIHVLASGATWCSKENAAATLLSLSTIHAYRRRLGRNQRVVTELVALARKGPASAKKDALAAILSLAGDRENIAHLVECGVVESALEAVSSTEVTEEAVAVLAALAKRGGATAVMKSDGSISKLVGVMRRGSDWSKENAAAALVLLCRREGAAAVSELSRIPGIEWVIWELTGSGTVRGRRKAAALGRIYRRWLAAVEEADRMVRFSPASISSSATTAQS